MSQIGAAPRAAVPVSQARAEASRRNGAKSRGPKTPEGKARSAQNALKNGLRAQKHVVLAQEDAAEFAQFQAALLEELAPVGVLQTVLARRIVIAAWRLARADRMEAEVLEERGWACASPGLALIRDGNGTRSIETLVRYRNAAMAEFTRALRTLQALQAGTGERKARPAALPAPNEPGKARNSRSLVARTALVAAMPPARAAADRPPSLPGAVPRLAPPARPRAPRRPHRPRMPDEPEKHTAVISLMSSRAGRRCPKRSTGDLGIEDRTWGNSGRSSENRL